MENYKRHKDGRRRRTERYLLMEDGLVTCSTTKAVYHPTATSDRKDYICNLKTATGPTDQRLCRQVYELPKGTERIYRVCRNYLTAANEREETYQSRRGQN